MATYLFIANTAIAYISPNLNSTKVKVSSNVACYYAVGTSPVATANTFMLQANTIRDINLGPGTQTIDANSATITTGVGPKISFLSIGAIAGITVTEVGSVDFTKVTA
jgi:hypothetical protein